MTTRRGESSTAVEPAIEVVSDRLKISIGHLSKAQERANVILDRLWGGGSEPDGAPSTEPVSLCELADVLREKTHQLNDALEFISERM